MSYLLTWEKKPVIDKETNIQIGEYTMIWLAVDRNKLEVIAFHVGGSAREDAKVLWKKVTHSCIPLIVCTNGNYSYNNVITN